MTSSRSVIHRSVQFIHHYFIWVIVGSYLVASTLPSFGLWIRDVEFGLLQLGAFKLSFSLPPLLLATLLFNAGLGVHTGDLKQLAEKPIPLIGGVIGNVATPLIFIMLLSYAMTLWHNPDEVQQILVGLALVASMPIAGASTAWAQNANGNLALSLGLVLMTTFLSPVLTPMSLHAVGLVTTGDYSEDLHELAAHGVVGFLGVWVILPSLLGIWTRSRMGETRFNAIKTYLKLLNYMVLIVLNYSNASLTLPNAIANPDLDFLLVTLVIVVSLCFLAFATGFGLSKLFESNRSSQVSLMFGLGMNNNGTGLVLASLSLADHPEVMLPIIFYNLVQHLVAGIIDASLFRSKSHTDHPN